MEGAVRDFDINLAVHIATPFGHQNGVLLSRAYIEDILFAQVQVGTILKSPGLHSGAEPK